MIDKFAEAYLNRYWINIELIFNDVFGSEVFTA